MYSERVLGEGVVLWSSSGSGGGPVPADGAADLILRNDELLVAGPSTRWINSAADAGGTTIGVRLVPGDAARVLGAGLAELRDRVVPAADVLGVGRADRLLARMAEIAEHDLQGAAVEGMFRAEVIGEVAPWVAVARSAAKGGVPMVETARLLGWSERSFRRHMDAAFGYGYPTLLRIERAVAARRRIMRGAGLAEVAYALGYADQAHLTRELKRFAGATPTELALQAAF